MKYEEPKPISFESARRLLEEGDVEETQRALVGVAYHEADLSAAVDFVVAGTEAASAEIRATAAICLGHLARIHRTLPDVALAAVKRCLHDPDPLVRGQATDAAGDVKVFAPDLAERLLDEESVPGDGHPLESNLPTIVGALPVLLRALLPQSDERPLGLVIVKDDSGFFLFQCGDDWYPNRDTWHETLDEAKSQAEFDFPDVKLHWLESP
jgi:hypothetical protein